MKGSVANLLWAALWAGMAMLTGDVAIETWAEGSDRAAGAAAVIMAILALVFVVGTCIFYLLGTSSLQPVGYRREATLALLIFIASMTILLLAGLQGYPGLTMLLSTALASLPVLRRRAHLS